MNTTELIQRVRETRSKQIWVREKAVHLLIKADYGHLVSPETLSSIPVRGRYKGRFCQTRHYRSLYGYVMDDRNTAHSVWFCPAATCDTGYGRWNKMDGEIDITISICGACVHMEDHSERVGRILKTKWVLSENAQTSNRDYNIPSGARAQSVMMVLNNLKVATLEEILERVEGKLCETSVEAHKDFETTSNTVYRLAKTGVVEKFGRGKKAVYCVR